MGWVGGWVAAWKWVAGCPLAGRVDGLLLSVYAEKEKGKTNPWLAPAGAIISWQRNFDAYLAAQQARRWDKSIDNFQFRDCALVRVGIMGAGNMGGATARLLLAARYPVSTWTRGPATVAGATCFHGREQLREFVEGNDVVICLVPLTDETSGILNAELFSWLPQGALVINVSRGQHLVEEDLLVALDSGHLSAAVLDGGLGEVGAGMGQVAPGGVAALSVGAACSIQGGGGEVTVSPGSNPRRSVPPGATAPRVPAVEPSQDQSFPPHRGHHAHRERGFADGAHARARAAWAAPAAWGCD